MDAKGIEACYAALEAMRIAMGASLTTAKNGSNPMTEANLQRDARNTVNRLKAAIDMLEQGTDVPISEIFYLLLEVSRITMGASLASMSTEHMGYGPGYALQGDSGRLVNRLKVIRDYFSV